MPLMISYLVKLSISLAVICLFYQLVLRKITFYQWNRWFLLVCTSFAFAIPLIDITPALKNTKWENAPVISAIPQLQREELTVPVINTSPEQGVVNTAEYILMVIPAGAFILFIVFLGRYFSFRRMKKQARLVAADGVKLYEVNDDIIPFSFGNSIFINSQNHTDDELKEIFRHEYVHVKQAHTVDVIWSEVLCMLNWYNPFAWMLRFFIRQNLEFIADEKVLQAGVDRKDYQYLLLKVIGHPAFTAASAFNFSSLKKRIFMMNKIKSGEINLLKFTLFIPLVAVIFLSFRKHDANRKADVPMNKRQSWDSTDTLPDDYNSFLKRNPSIRNVSWSADPLRINIYLKNKRKEVYKLQQHDEVRAAEAKYGKLPQAPPAPPSAPEKRSTSAKPADYQNFLSRNPGVKGLAWTESSVFVHFEQGGYNKFELHSESDMAKFETLYGRLPKITPDAARKIEVSKGFDEFVRRNPGVRSFGFNVNSMKVEVGRVRNNKKPFSYDNQITESYFINRPEDLRLFEEKYGPLPGYIKKQG